MTPQKEVIPGRKYKTLEVAKDQDQYQTLPSIRTFESTNITRWKLTLKERLILLFEGSLWVSQKTFYGPLQPIRLDVEPPTDIINSEGAPLE